MHSLLGDDSVSSRGDVAALLTRLGFDEHNAAEAAAAPAAVSDDDGWVFFVDSVMQRLVGSNSPRRRAAPGGYDARRVASSVTASAARRSLLAVATEALEARLAPEETCVVLGIPSSLSDVAAEPAWRMCLNRVIAASVSAECGAKEPVVGAQVVRVGARPLVAVFVPCGSADGATAASATLHGLRVLARDHRAVALPLSALCAAVERPADAPAARAPAAARDSSSQPVVLPPLTSRRSEHATAAAPDARDVLRALRETNTWLQSRAQQRVRPEHESSSEAEEGRDSASSSSSSSVDTASTASDPDPGPAPGHAEGSGPRKAHSGTLPSGAAAAADAPPPSTAADTASDSGGSDADGHAWEATLELRRARAEQSFLRARLSLAEERARAAREAASEAEADSDRLREQARQRGQALLTAVGECDELTRTCASLREEVQSMREDMARLSARTRVAEESARSARAQGGYRTAPASPAGPAPAAECAVCECGAAQRQGAGPLRRIALLVGAAMRAAVALAAPSGSAIGAALVSGRDGGGSAADEMASVCGEAAALLQKLHEAQRAVLASQREEADASMCVVCLQERRSVVLLPCRHLSVCRGCAAHQSLRTCPLCRTQIADRLDVYDCAA